MWIHLCVCRICHRIVVLPEHNLFFSSTPVFRWAVVLPSYLAQGIITWQCFHWKKRKNNNHAPDFSWLYFENIFPCFFFVDPTPDHVNRARDNTHIIGSTTKCKKAAAEERNFFQRKEFQGKWLWEFWSFVCSGIFFFAAFLVCLFFAFSPAMHDWRFSGVVRHAFTKKKYYRIAQNSRNLLWPCNGNENRNKTANIQVQFACS